MAKFQAGPYYLKANEVAVRLTEGDDGKLQLALLGHMPAEGKETDDVHFVARDIISFLLGRNDEMHAEYVRVPRGRRLTIVPKIKSDVAHEDTGGE